MQKELHIRYGLSSQSGWPGKEQAQGQIRVSVKVVARLGEIGPAQVAGIERG